MNNNQQLLENMSVAFDDIQVLQSYRKYHDMDNFKYNYPLMVRKHETENAYYAKDIFGNYINIQYENGLPVYCERCDFEEELDESIDYYLTVEKDVDTLEFDRFKVIKKINFKYNDAGKLSEQEFDISFSGIKKHKITILHDLQLVKNIEYDADGKMIQTHSDNILSDDLEYLDLEYSEDDDDTEDTLEVIEHDNGYSERLIDEFGEDSMFTYDDNDVLLKYENNEMLVEYVYGDDVVSKYKSTFKIENDTNVEIHYGYDKHGYLKSVKTTFGYDASFKFDKHGILQTYEDNQGFKFKNS